MQPVDGLVTANVDIANKAQLAAELSSQILRQSAILSKGTIVNRRVNEAAGLRKKYNNLFVTAVEKVEKSDLSKLFGGKGLSLIKSKARELRDVESLEKVT